MAATKRKKVAKSRKAARVVRAKTKKRAAQAKAASQPKLLTGEQLRKVFQLISKASSVEMKVTVPATGTRATVKSLKLDPVEAQPRQAYFFDTPKLDLYKAGLVVRVRRIQGGGADTVIKLRPVDPAAIDAELRRSAAFKTEVDVMPGGFVCSASFKGVCTGQEVLAMTAGQARLSSLFTKEQRAFFRAHAPARIKMDSLVTLGPVFLLKARHQPKGYDRRVTVELWLYPDGSRILEVSAKCMPNEAFQAGAEFRDFLASIGIPVDGAQEPKTRFALEYFRDHRD